MQCSILNILFLRRNLLKIVDLLKVIFMHTIYRDFTSFVREVFNQSDGQVILHDPRFIGNERKYLMDAMDSNFVSSVGEYVGKFEKAVAEYTGAKYAVAAVNGTSALHIAMLLAGVEKDEEVITQPVSFIATCNAITYAGARPVFVDVALNTMGMCPDKLDRKSVV